MSDTEALDDVDTLLSILGELTSEQEVDSGEDDDADSDDDDDDDDVDDDSSNDESGDEGRFTALDCCLGLGESDVKIRGGDRVSLVGYTFFTAMRIFQNFLRSKVKDFVDSGQHRSRRYVTIVTGSERSPGHGPAVRNNVRYFLTSNGYSLTCAEGQDCFVVDLENSFIC
ncbi:hypothetical protein Btru_060698 [Bulinus truncatus]|nr:hypothetical protein Btru_060698 [Bulinus truncatus]